jgi:hypothetical protein
VRDKFLQNAIVLQEDAQAFAGAPLEAQLEMFPHFAANVAALDRLLGPFTALGTAADAERAVERPHRELMEEICRGQRDLANLLLEHLRYLLAWALCLLGVAISCVAPLPFAPARAIDDDEVEDEDDDKEDEE